MKYVITSINEETVLVKINIRHLKKRGCQETPYQQLKISILNQQQISFFNWVIYLKIFIESVLCTRYFSSRGGYTSEKNRQKLCPPGT